MMNDRTYFVCSTISRVSLCIDVEDTCNLRMSSPLAGRFRDVCVASVTSVVDSDLE